MENLNEMVNGPEKLNEEVSLEQCSAHVQGWTTDRQLFLPMQLSPDYLREPESLVGALVGGTSDHQADIY